VRRGEAIRTGTRVVDPIRTMRVIGAPAAAGFAGFVIHGAIGRWSPWPPRSVPDAWVSFVGTDGMPAVTNSSPTPSRP
jgi:hypothetical protein